MPVIQWFIRNPVAANLLMVFILVAGVLSFLQLRSEIFPKLPATSLSINVVFPGRTAEQVDKGLTYKVERSLEGVEGVKTVYSQSQQDLLSVKVVRQDGHDLDQLLQDVKLKVEAIDGWPAQAERPVIEKDSFSYPSLIVQIFGGEDLETRQRVMRQLKAALLAQPDISKVKVWGEEAYRVRLEVDPHQLLAYGLKLSDVASAINANSITAKGGLLKTASGTLYIIADEQAYHRREFETLVVKTFPDGRQLYLSDLAHIADAYQEHDVLVRYQGKEAIGLSVKAGAKSDLLEISRQAKQVLAELRPQLPHGVELSIWSDLSVYIESRLSLMQSNALQGIALVFLMLALFLNIRLAFWVAMGLPVAIAGTFIFMGESFLGFTLNELTTFGFILVLGILVDDAVVVGESVHSEKKHCISPLLATQAGVKRVAIPTIFGIATTIAAFYPMTQISNELGKLFASFAWIVIAALFMSLIESKLILPAHLAHSKPTRPNIIQTYANRMLEGLNQHFYDPALRLALKHRYACLTIFVSLIIGVFGLMQKGQVKTVFFPEVPEDLISVKIDMNENTPLALIRHNARKVTEAADIINTNYKRDTGSTEGIIQKQMMVVSELGIEVFAELLPQHERKMDVFTLLRTWRAQVGNLEAAWNTEFKTAEGTGAPLAELVLVHEDRAILNQAKDILIQQVTQLTGVVQVTDNLKASLPQMNFSLTPQARQWGLTTQDLTSQLGANLGGLEVQRMQRANSEVRVELRYPQKDRDSVIDLNKVWIQNEQGQAFPLAAVTERKLSFINSEIIRKNGHQYASVWVKVDKSVISPEQVYATLAEQQLIQLKAQFPGLEINPAGELEESKKAKAGLKKALWLSLLAIYTLLAIPLRSYGQPLIIMSVIPFGLVGAVFGHMWLDLPVSIFSFLGMLALSGVVVNDSLVLISNYNQRVINNEKQRDIKELLVATGKSRLRAIFLTTVTTFVGLMPLMAETAEQAQYLIPAAVSLAYGELFATLITLLLVPVLLAIADDIKQLLTKSNQAPVTSPAQETI